MSGADLQELEQVKGLIARGLQVGVLTYAEIATATAELGLEDTDVEELHGVFERCEIELIEEIDPAAAAGLRVEPAARGLDRQELPQPGAAVSRFAPHPRTLEEVGRAFNVTRERIRQIENQSLKKLQNLHPAQQLRDDLEIASPYPPRTRKRHT
jgi:Sigma-70, region 4/Sigma-70 factor, region 1.1